MSKINKIRFSGTTYDIEDLNSVKVNELTQAEYDSLPSSAKTNGDLYIISDAEGASLTDYYTKSETDDLLDEKLDVTAYTPTDLSNYYTKSETSSSTQISTALNAKQNTLVSGTNIKTINNESILGSGNITVQGGGGGSYEAGTNISITDGDTTDTINCTLPITATSYDIKFGDGLQSSTWSILIGKNINANGGYYNLIMSPSQNNSSTVTETKGYNIVALGGGITVSGTTSSNNGDSSVAIGSGVNVYGPQSLSLGASNTVKGYYSQSIGRSAGVTGDTSIAIGNLARVSGNSSVAIGNNAKVSGDSSVAIGSGATANGVDYKTNLNNQLKVTPTNQIYIYDKTNTEMICLQDKLDAITTALGGLSLVKITQSAYDALATKDSNTLYVIVN